MSFGPDIQNIYLVVLLGSLLYVSRNLPVFAFARSRRLPYSWVALLSPFDLFVLMACVGVPRRHILWFAGVACGAALGLLAVVVATGGGTQWQFQAKLWLSPDIIAVFLWMAACRDVGISRGWGVLAAWPYVGWAGAWRIVLEVKGRIT